MYITPIKGSVVISGTKIDIVIDDAKCLEHEADGLFNEDTIYLRSEYDTIQDYLLTYRHECFHALCEILGVQFDANLEEIFAHRVSTMYTFEV